MAGPLVVDIRNSFGAAFVGLLVSTTLFGLTIAQTCIYFWNYRDRDPKPLKFFVAFVVFMDALHTIVCTYAIYWYLIVNFGNVENLQYSVWALDLQAVLSTVIFISVQLYYARRVYIVSQSLICPIIIVVSVFIVAFFAICELPALRSSFRSGTNFKLRLPVFVVKEISLKRFSDFHSSAWMSYIAFGATTVGDTLVAMSMCWSLYSRRTGFARTDSIIMTSMAYSINSGLLTGLLSIASSICIVVSPSSMIWLAFFWAMSKCYVNSLLAMLNSRNYVRGSQSTANRQDNAYNISSIRVGPGPWSTLDYGRNKSDHDEEPTFEVPKPVARTIPFRVGLFLSVAVLRVDPDVQRRYRDEYSYLVYNKLSRPPGVVLNALSDVREFYIHVLVSAPTKRNSESIYPYAFLRPCQYSQDINRSTRIHLKFSSQTLRPAFIMFFPLIVPSSSGGTTPGWTYCRETSLDSTALFSCTGPVSLPKAQRSPRDTPDTPA
ncbi:hypothetical protein EDB89DRAFT_2227799 [Lactarius sanguifluus]|nr:hypothetical protein EDB89DRAFT_2227799 [Lactarius sanguifluus]